MRTALYPLLSPVVRRLPAYTRLAWRLGRDRRLTRAQRAIVLGGVAYVMSPLDLIPGLIPVLGQMDDIAVALWSLRTVLRRLPPEIADEHLTAAGLTRDDIDADLGRLSRSGRLFTVAGARLGWRGLRGAGRIALHLSRRLRGQ